MAERVYFDCNAWYGPGTQRFAEERWRLQEVLDDLDLAGIAGALVHHAQAIEYDTMMGNRRLLDEIAPYRERLYPCWVALPNLCDDFPDADDFAAEARRADVRAVRIEPAPMGVPVRESVLGSLRDAIHRENMLVLISGPGFGNDTDLMDRFLCIFKGCNVLLTDVSWGMWREVLALMHDHHNLHLEFSTFQGNRAVEVIAARFGVERCLFGTGLPRKAPGAARGFLDWSLLSESEADLVAGGNLCRLLRGAGPSRAPSPGPWHDSLTDAARSGCPLPCFIADNHCHVLHDNGCNAGRRHLMPGGGVDQMMELTRMIGVDKTAMMSWAGPLSGDPDTGNRIVEQAVRRYPDEVVGLVTIRPELQSEDEMRETIRHYHEALRWPGLKPFPRVTLDYDDPGFDLWFRYANEHRLYMVFDPATQGPPGTPVVEHLACSYPDLVLTLDHCGKSWPYAKWAVDMCRRFPRVYAQLNYTLVTNGIVEYIVDAVGPERVLFGTDAPMRDPRPQAAWLAFTRLPEETKRRIFGANFQAILDRAFRAPAEETGS